MVKSESPEAAAKQSEMAKTKKKKGGLSSLLGIARGDKRRGSILRGSNSQTEKQAKPPPIEELTYDNTEQTKISDITDREERRRRAKAKQEKAKADIQKSIVKPPEISSLESSNIFDQKAYLQQPRSSSAERQRKSSTPIDKQNLTLDKGLSLVAPSPITLDQVNVQSPADGRSAGRITPESIYSTLSTKEEEPEEKTDPLSPATFVVDGIDVQSTSSGRKSVDPPERHNDDGLTELDSPDLVEGINETAEVEPNQQPLVTHKMEEPEFRGDGTTQPEIISTSTSPAAKSPAISPGTLNSVSPSERSRKVPLKKVQALLEKVTGKKKTKKKTPSFPSLSEMATPKHANVMKSSPFVESDGDQRPNTEEHQLTSIFEAAPATWTSTVGVLTNMAMDPSPRGIAPKGETVQRAQSPPRARATDISSPMEPPSSPVPERRVAMDAPMDCSTFLSGTSKSPVKSPQSELGSAFDFCANPAFSGELPDSLPPLGLTKSGESQKENPKRQEKVARQTSSNPFDKESSSMRSGASPFHAVMQEERKPFNPFDDESGKNLNVQKEAQNEKSLSAFGKPVLKPFNPFDEERSTNSEAESSPAMKETSSRSTFEEARAMFESGIQNPKTTSSKGVNPFDGSSEDSVGEPKGFLAAAIAVGTAALMPSKSKKPKRGTGERGKKHRRISSWNQKKQKAKKTSSSHAAAKSPTSKRFGKSSSKQKEDKLDGTTSPDREKAGIRAEILSSEVEREEENPLRDAPPVSPRSNAAPYDRKESTLPIEIALEPDDPVSDLDQDSKYFPLRMVVAGESMTMSALDQMNDDDTLTTKPSKDADHDKYTPFFSSREESFVGPDEGAKGALADSITEWSLNHLESEDTNKIAVDIMVKTCNQTPMGRMIVKNVFDKKDEGTAPTPNKVSRDKTSAGIEPPNVIIDGSTVELELGEYLAPCSPANFRPRIEKGCQENTCANNHVSSQTTEIQVVERNGEVAIRADAEMDRYAALAATSSEEIPVQLSARQQYAGNRLLEFGETMACLSPSCRHEVERKIQMLSPTSRQILQRSVAVAESKKKEPELIDLSGVDSLDDLDDDGVWNFKVTASDDVVASPQNLDSGTMLELTNQRISIEKNDKGESSALESVMDYAASVLKVLDPEVPAPAHVSAPNLTSTQATARTMVIAHPEVIDLTDAASIVEQSENAGDNKELLMSSASDRIVVSDDGQNIEVQSSSIDTSETYSMSHMVTKARSTSALTVVVQDQSGEVSGSTEVLLSEKTGNSTRNEISQSVVPRLRLASRRKVTPEFGVLVPATRKERETTNVLHQEDKGMETAPSNNSGPLTSVPVAVKRDALDYVFDGAESLVCGHQPSNSGNSVMAESSSGTRDVNTKHCDTEPIKSPEKSVLTVPTPAVARRDALDIVCEGAERLVCGHQPSNTGNSVMAESSSEQKQVKPRTAEALICKNQSESGPSIKLDESSEASCAIVANQSEDTEDDVFCGVNDSFDLPASPANTESRSSQTVPDASRPLAEVSDDKNLDDLDSQSCGDENVADKDVVGHKTAPKPENSQRITTRYSSTGELKRGGTNLLLEDSVQAQSESSRSTIIKATTGGDEIDEGRDMYGNTYSKLEREQMGESSSLSQSGSFADRRDARPEESGSIAQVSENHLENNEALTRDNVEDKGEHNIVSDSDNREAASNALTELNSQPTDEKSCHSPPRPEGTRRRSAPVDDIEVASMSVEDRGDIGHIVQKEILHRLSPVDADDLLSQKVTSGYRAAPKPEVSPKKAVEGRNSIQSSTQVEEASSKEEARLESNLGVCALSHFIEGDDPSVPIVLTAYSIDGDSIYDKSLQGTEGSQSSSSQDGETHGRMARTDPGETNELPMLSKEICDVSTPDLDKESVKVETVDRIALAKSPQLVPVEEMESADRILFARSPSPTNAFESVDRIVFARTPTPNLQDTSSKVQEDNHVQCAHSLDRADGSPFIIDQPSQTVDSIASLQSQDPLMFVEPTSTQLSVSNSRTPTPNLEENTSILKENDQVQHTHASNQADDSPVDESSQAMDSITSSRSPDHVDVQPTNSHHFVDNISDTSSHSSSKDGSDRVSKARASVVETLPILQQISKTTTPSTYPLAEKTTTPSTYPLAETTDKSALIIPFQKESTPGARKGHALSTSGEMEASNSFLEYFGSQFSLASPNEGSISSDAMPLNSYQQHRSLPSTSYEQMEPLEASSDKDSHEAVKLESPGEKRSGESPERAIIVHEASHGNVVAPSSTSFNRLWSSLFCLDYNGPSDNVVLSHELQTIPEVEEENVIDSPMNRSQEETTRSQDLEERHDEQPEGLEEGFEPRRELVLDDENGVEVQRPPSTVCSLPPDHSDNQSDSISREGQNEQRTKTSDEDEYQASISPSSGVQPSSSGVVEQTEGSKGADRQSDYERDVGSGQAPASSLIDKPPLLTRPPCVPMTSKKPANSNNIHEVHNVVESQRFNEVDPVISIKASSGVESPRAQKEPTNSSSKVSFSSGNTSIASNKEEGNFGKIKVLGEQENEVASDDNGRNFQEDVNVPHEIEISGATKVRVATTDQNVSNQTQQQEETKKSQDTTELLRSRGKDDKSELVLNSDGQNADSIQDSVVESELQQNIIPADDVNQREDPIDLSRALSLTSYPTKSSDDGYPYFYENQESDDFDRAPPNSIQKVLERLRQKETMDSPSPSISSDPTDVDDLLSKWSSTVHNLVVCDEERLAATKSGKIGVINVVTKSQSKLEAAKNEEVSEHDVDTTPNRGLPKDDAVGSMSFGSEFSSTPSQKARDLKTELDIALQTSAAIRNEHKKLGADLTSLQSRLLSSRAKPEIMSTPRAPSPGAGAPEGLPEAAASDVSFSNGREATGVEDNTRSPQNRYPERESVSTPTPKASNSIPDKFPPASPTLSDTTRKFDRLQYAKRYKKFLEKEGTPPQNYEISGVEEPDDNSEVGSDEEDETMLSALDSIIHGLRNAEERKMAVVSSVTNSFKLEDE